MSKSKMVCMGEWVRVANLRNKRFAAGNPCSRCGRLACAPVWYSLETHEVRCTRCFDAWKLYWKTDYPWVVMIGAETDWPMLRDRLRHCRRRR
jgi:hypothetical protein